MRALLLMTILAAGCFLSACSSIPGKMDKLEIGMSKAKVIELMGSADERTVTPSSEILIYTHSGVGVEYYKAYFVEIVNGKVESFGRGRDSGRVVAVPIQMPQATYQPIPVSKPVSCTSQKNGNMTYTNCN